MLSYLAFAAVVGCSSGIGAGTPPAPGVVNGQTAPNPAANVTDDQAAGDVADYYLQRMAFGALDQRVENRIAALNAFAARAAAASSPAPSANSRVTLAAPAALPTSVPTFQPQQLEPPAFPSDDGPAKKLADQGGATLAHRVVDPRSPTQTPIDQIEIARGAVQWRIDLLTGLVTYQKQHTTGVIETGAERAQEVAEAFVQRHGGIPDDAVEVKPVYALTQGDSASVPKPTSITFVWRHNDPTIIGADAITVTVSPKASNISASPAPDSGLEVTAFSRLWRKAGKALDAGKTAPMTAAQALAALERSAAVPSNEKVNAVVFGGLRGPASAAPRATQPAWAFLVGDAWYAVDALSGSVSTSASLGVPSDAIGMVPTAKSKSTAENAAAPASSPSPR